MNYHSKIKGLYEAKKTQIQKYFVIQNFYSYRAHVKYKIPLKLH